MCVSILLLLWLSQIMFLNIAYENYQIRTVDNIAKKILKNSNYNLDEIAYQKEICIEKISPSGITFYNSKMVGCNLKTTNNELASKIKEFYNSSDNLQRVKIIDRNHNIKAFVSVLKSNDDVIVLYSALEDISGASSLLKSQLIYIVIVVIILSVFLSYFLSKKITDPIKNISDSAKKLGNGNYNVVFKKNGIAEIDELADTLNGAAHDLSKIDELRRDLMANVSHDLKTPLTMIKAYAEMIKDISYKDKKKLDENINIIISETDRLNNLVNDILELSKLQNNPNSLNIEKYDLVAEINNIISKYGIIKETEKYVIATEMPIKAYVLADKKRINQVIYNLLNNAINYTGKDKKVTIKVIEQKKNYLVKIIDSGKGIKEEELPYIWNKYYKNDKNHQRNVVGTGLGLSIVKEALERHHFKYGVNSVKNKGTTFYFEITSAKK